MNRGDTIKMSFKAFGVTSFEDVVVTVVTDNEIFIENTRKIDQEPWEESYRFDRKTGKCLNDTTFLGAQRSIKPAP